MTNDKKPLVVDTFHQEIFSPVLPVAPILSSAKGWDCLHVGYYRQPAWETPEVTFLQHTITIYTGKPVSIELQAEGRWQRKTTYTHGAVGIYPAFAPHTVNWNDEIEFVEIDLDPQFLTRFVDESLDCDRDTIIPQSAIHDPLIYGIGMALKAELVSDGLGSRLYAESAATMLAVHILRHYSSQNYTIKEVSLGLSRARLRQVIDYINTYLDRNLSLLELAKLVQMSPHHFARLFKQSTGFSPHQYLLNCRIQAAKNLLAKQDLSIAEIAFQVGFHDQSRFTSVFRKHTGVTPKKYRDRI